MNLPKAAAISTAARQQVRRYSYTTEWDESVGVATMSEINDPYERARLTRFGD